MNGIFLDASILRNQSMEDLIKEDIKQSRVLYEFPNGLEKLRLIEECRALNALDVSDPDNFDFMYDITMQMLVGKPVFIYYLDDNEEKHLLGKFVVTNRYMNLRTVDIIDEFPILVNWLVEFIAGMLGKKYPRSLQSFQATMSEREERMKSLKQEQEEQIKVFAPTR